MTAQHESLSAFFAMGGYGYYVWLAYGVVVATLLANVWYAIWRGQQLRGELRRRLQAEASGRAGRQPSRAHASKDQPSNDLAS